MVLVTTPDRQITALGTKFNVRLTGEGTSVAVTQGKVRVSGTQLPIYAGQQLAPHAGKPSEGKRAPSLEGARLFRECLSSR